MPKISDLTPVGALDGSETILIVKDGATWRGSVSQFLQGAVGAEIDQAVAQAGTGLISGGAFTMSASGRLLGRTAPGPGRVQEITLGVGLTLAGGVLSAPPSGSGTVTSVNASGGSTGLSFSGGPITSAGTLTLGGTLAVASGGTGAASAAGARTSLGAAAAGAIGSSALTMETGRILGRTTAETGAIEQIVIGSGLSLSGGVLSAVGGGSGTVTSVNASGGSTGLSFSGGPVTGSGTLTLGGTLALASGGTGAASAAGARTNLGATTVGANLFTLANPSAIRFLRLNADNTVTPRTAAELLGDIAAAPLASPNFTGNPSAPTPAAGDNNGSIATTGFVQSELMPSVQSLTNISTVTPNGNPAGDDAVVITALAANLTIAAPTGSPVQMKPLIFRIRDNGTVRTLTWNAIYRAVGVTLPTATVANRTLYVGFLYNATELTWDCVLVRQQA